MRRLIAFSCEGAALLGTLDEASGTTGLLIVSGGNEVRAGAHRGMAALAARVAAGGHPVFRFDRRGVGDSSGENAGWESSGPDLAAAAAAFRREQPQVHRLVGFGNCDGATALALFGREAGIDAIVLANPWLSADPLPPPAAVRRHYTRRLFDRATWARLFGGRIDMAGLAAGLRRTVTSTPAPPLAGQIARSLAGMPATLVLAAEDRTAQQFAAACPTLAESATQVATASHSFAGEAAASLEAAILAALTS